MREHPALIKSFTYFINDSLSQPEVIDALRGLLPEVEFTDELVNKIGRPFYEVRLDCELNIRTGQVVIRGATG